MLNFKCTNCQNEIQAEYQYIGDMVQCPICSSLQVVPDPVLPNGSEYHGYMIGKVLASTMLWTTYSAVGRTEQPDRHVVIRVPSTFFLKSVSDFEAFVDTVIKTGSLNKSEIPSLIDRSLVPGKVYFVYEFVQTAYKVSYFSGERLLDYANALVIIRAIASTLKEVWEKDYLIHQNLIPSNIRITNKFNVRITNIGISDFLLHDQQLLQYGFNIWDYQYMSPEFITQGIANTPSCDIYSLGGILFLLCTGHPPHKNVAPTDIPAAPIPSLTDYMEDVPEKLTSMIQLMMAPNPQLRLKSWDEVIERIDKITTDTTKLKSQNVLQNYKFKGARSGRYEPVGLHPGGFEKNIEKSSTGKYPQQRQAMTDTVARLASKDEMKALNKEWNQIRKSSTGRIRKPAKKTGNYTALIAFAIIAIIGGTSLFIAFMSWKGKQDIKPGYTAKTRKEIPAPSPSRKEKVAEKSITPEKKPVPSVGKPLKTKSDLEEKLLAIDEFYLNNPEKTNDVSERYESLMTEAVKTRKFTIVDIIQGKINNISDAATRHEATKVDTVIAVIKKQILPLLKAEKYDEALDIVRNYDGDLSNETRRARLDLALKIEDKIAKIEDADKESSNAIQKFTAKFAPALMQGKILDAKIKMELGLKLEESDMVKEQVTTWLTEVKNFEKLRKRITKKITVDSIIDNPDNESFIKDAYLLQGLLYTEAEQYIKAEQTFEKLPYGSGSAFIAILKENKANNAFREIMGKYEFRYDTTSPSTILLQLTQKTINKDKAEALKKDIVYFTKEFPNSTFLKKNTNIIDALNTYCARITGETDAEILNENAIKPDETKTKTGEPLLEALANAKTGAKIVLSKGLFKIDSLPVNQADLTISGTENVHISAKKILLSGHDIAINNITFDDGTLKIEKARNITFNNCTFNGREIEISGSRSITFNNSLIQGVYIKECKEILFTHCTMLTPKGGIEAALRMESEGIEIADSIIYGEKYAIMTIKKNDNPRKRYIHHSLWFGEKALAVKQFENQPVEDKNIATKSSKLRRYVKTKSNIYKPPQFINPKKGNYRLVKGVPGSGGASDKKDCGVIW